MQYNFKKIGNRIRDERKRLWVKKTRNQKGYELGPMPVLDQDGNTTLKMDAIMFSRDEADGFLKADRNDFIAICKTNYGVEGLNTNKLSLIENGEADMNTFSLQLLNAFSQVFDCEIGFILCEEGYEKRTRKTTDLCKGTGLSPEAVTWIQYIMSHGDFEALQGTRAWDGKAFDPENADFYKFIYGEYSALSNQYQPVPVRLSQLFDDFITSGCMDLFIKELRNYVRPKYVTPVFIDESTKNVFTSPCTPLAPDENKDKLVNSLLLADPSSLRDIYGKTPRNQADYIHVPLTGPFMQRVALDNIEKSLDKFSEDFNKNYDPKGLRVKPNQEEDNKKG